MNILNLPFFLKHASTCHLTNPFENGNNGIMEMAEFSTLSLKSKKKTIKIGRGESRGTLEEGEEGEVFFRRCQLGWGTGRGAKFEYFEFSILKKKEKVKIKWGHSLISFLI